MEEPVRVCGGSMAVDLLDEKDKKSGTLTMPLRLLFVFLLTRPKFFQLYDPGLIPYSPGNNLFCMFAVVGLDDRPAAVMAVVAAPFKIMEVACSMDFLDNGITVTGVVRGFDKKAVHGLPLLNNG